LANIRGIKVVYPSTGADLKGLLKAAFYDPNPVVILEHKGLYWSKIPGTEGAMSIEPSADYVVPIGKARIALEANPTKIDNGESIGIITYGRGVYWSLEAASQFDGQVEILDLRTINPLDIAAMEELCQRHGKILLVTEETTQNSFTLAIAGRLQNSCFAHLDAPIEIVASVDAPAIPLNSGLEAAMLPNAQKVATAISKLLNY
jgi:2-oxoisovalerate dehydrogenase E1 component